MRLAVVADIHANLLALDAVVADMGARRVDAAIDLGDSVSGPLWPRETLERLRGLGWPSLRGNHDRWVGEDATHTLGRTDAFAHAALDAEGRRWLADLPSRRDLLPDVVAFHACPADDNAYLLEDVVAGRLVPARPAAVAARLGTLAARLVLCAHSHIAGLLRLPDGRWIVNPGSVGCPAYDDPTPPAHVSESGSPAARYAIVTLGAEADAAPAVEFLAIPYDHAAASRRALALDRPDWALALATGFSTP